MRIALKTKMSDNLYESYKDYLWKYYNARAIKENGFVRVSYEANTVQCMEIVAITNLYCLSEEVPEWD